MSHRHWSDDELLLRLYEGGPESGSEFSADGCAECHARWERLLAARAIILQSPEVSPALLMRQREAIRQRIGKPAGNWFPRFAPALATACLLVLGIMLGTPTPQRQPTMAQNDDSLYSEVYAMAWESTPSPVAPIQGLFDMEVAGQ